MLFTPKATEKLRSNSTLYSLQLCRGIAALMVVYHHVAHYVDTFYHDYGFRSIFDFGFAGVDFFFLLSGFVIFYSCYKMIDHRDQLLTYSRKRFVRVYPVYWLLMLPLLLAFTLMSGTINKDYTFSWIEFVKTWTLYPGHKNLTGVSWSLSHEIYFYILFGLLLISRRFFALLWLVVALSGINLLIIIFQLPVERSFMFDFLFSGHNIEFFLGAIAYYVIRQQGVERALYHWFILITGVTLFIASGFYLHLFHEILRVILFGAASFMILVSLVRLERMNKIHISAFWVRLGDASYVLYLVHYPIISLGNKVYQKSGLLSSIDYRVFNLSLIAVAVGIAFAIHLWIEKPILKALSLKNK